MSNKILNFTSGFKVKEVGSSGETIMIEGFANTTTKDRQGDIILQEAWTKGGLDNYLKNPIILAFHDHTKPIGSMVDYSVNDRGFSIVAEISKAAGDIYNLIKDGVIKTFSVGFRVKDADYDMDTDIFVIKDLELFEISAVSIPANADSVFSVRKCLETEEAIQDFKKEYSHMPPKETTEAVDVVKAAETATKEEMLKDLEASLDTKLKGGLDDLGSKLTDNIIAALELAAEQKGKEKMPEVKVVETGTEKLLAEITKRMEDQEKSVNETLDGLRTELKEKAEELEALQKSKMSFEDRGSIKISEKEIDDAIFIAKALGKPLEHTKKGRLIIEKSGAQHVPGAADSSEWEREFSNRIFSDVSNKLIIEPLFSTINMSTYSMQIPINPEAGVGQWITTANFRGASSTGTAVDHAVTDTTLTAHKLAAKEYLGYEEEEDAIIPIVPIIRDAVVRRMARSSDIALLLGDAGQTTGGSDVYPFNGIATLASDAGLTGTPLSIGAGDKVTVATLQEARKKLGVRGLNPGEVKYVVSQDAYFDLLEDPDFRTVDVVGAAATILTGQIGSAAGSPVMVSGEFAAKGAGAAAVVAVYTPNFVVGNLRGMMIERDRSIEEQKNIIVATRRVGFIPLIANVGVSSVSWAS